MGDQYEPIDFNAAAPPPPPPPPAGAPPPPAPAANNAAGDNQYEVPAFGTGAVPPPPPPPPPPGGAAKSAMDVASDSLASHKGRLSAQGEAGKGKNKSKLSPAAVKKFKAKKGAEEGDSVVSTVKKADEEGADENLQEVKAKQKPGGNIKKDIIVTVILLFLFLASAGAIVGVVAWKTKGKFGKFTL